MPPKKEDKGNKSEYNKKYSQQNKDEILAKRRQQYNKNPARQRALASRL